jgi:hypothetical protein
VCSIAFLAVFILLTFLAVIMYLITFIFPERKVGTDMAVVAAISSAFSTIYPGAQVIQIEEE